MHLSDERMIVILLVGVAAGYLAGRFARGSGSGLVGDAAVGIVGALIANWPSRGFDWLERLIALSNFPRRGATFEMLLPRQDPPKHLLRRSDIRLSWRHPTKRRARPRPRKTPAIRPPPQRLRRQRLAAICRRCDTRLQLSGAFAGRTPSPFGQPKLRPQPIGDTIAT